MIWWSLDDLAGLPSTGILYVLVNGTIAVKDSKVLEGVYPGQAIRAAIEYILSITNKSIPNHPKHIFGDFF